VDVAASAVGGALIGLTLGTVGRLVGLNHLSIVFLSGVCICCLWFAIFRAGERLGTRRQVRRRWQASPIFIHASWGVTLGAGLFTAIPYSVWLLVFGAESISGPAWGAVLGALLGIGRQLPILTTPFARLNAGQVVGLVDRWARQAQSINLVLVAVGGAALIVSHS
jgi:hypothetical protein